MHLLNADAYFHLASKGNKEALNTLYDIVIKRAHYIIKSKLRNSPKFSGNPDDFSNLVDKYFFQIINDYDSSRGSFSNYIDFVLETRLSAKVESNLISQAMLYAPLGNEEEDSSSLEWFADESETGMPSTIAMNSFKQMISSPSLKMGVEERIHQRIMMLQYAGYKNIEIAKILKITPGELRGHIKRIQEKDEILNLKLDLK